MAQEQEKPIRILHVLGMMGRGGVETWLMNILRMIDRDRYQMDFLVHVAEPQDYDAEIRALGSKVIICPYARQPVRYAREFTRVLHEHGPYDVVHSHVHLYSGYVLRLAQQAGVPIRIAHSHLAAPGFDARERLPRRMYRKLMRHWIHRHATAGLAVSRMAAADLFGPHWEEDRRFRLLFCGIDLDPFAAPVCRQEVRAELGIPDDAFVVGHVGRFSDAKNHALLVAIAAEAVKRAPNLRLLLIGEGELRPAIQEQVRRIGLTAHIIFAGSRPDVPRLLRGAMDAFCFPSRYEGLGLGLVEAQAAGLPCVLSDIIPHEADIVPLLVRRLSLHASPSTWAETLLATRNTPPAVSPCDALRIARATPFNVETSWQALERVYVGC